MTKASRHQYCNNVAFISKVEPTCIDQALEDEFWIKDMQEELDQFKRNEVWELVPKPKDKSIIGTKWVFKNKLDESENTIKIKEMLVAKGYYQEKDIDFEESYVTVARLETIKIILAFTSHMKFMLYQMVFHSIRMA